MEWIEAEPTSIYSRRIWFLYEFLMQKIIPIKDADKKIKFTPLIDETIQFALSNGSKSIRHRITNNLPGTVDFCPLITKTPKIKQYIEANLEDKNKLQINKIHKDILLRTSAFLLLKDSKASFNIEGENPIPSRSMRWGKAIGSAGKYPLSIAELERLQQVVIENSKFLKYGYREQDGFVGEHDRDTHLPIPEHISAKHQDLSVLMNGLISTNLLLEEAKYHPVLMAASIAFGFVFIHPFVDGNGRIHRYIIHHILAKNNFTPSGIIFPISASILHNIDKYRNVLEQFSQNLLPYIKWESTTDNNVKVLNETVDFYKYFDATLQTEFLFDSIVDTIETIIPQEVKYVEQYDEFKSYIDNEFEMPDKMVALLVKVLHQNNGTLSKKKKENDFNNLSDEDILKVEKAFKVIFEW
jgi:Fic family protein